MTTNKRLTVYLKPTCSKCRTVLRILKERGADFDAINYYEVPFKKSDLIELLRKLALHPRDILRKEEPVARRLGLCKKVLPDDALLDLMTQHPDLIQRPIVVRGNQATLGRPPENVKKLL